MRKLYFRHDSIAVIRVSFIGTLLESKLSNHKLFDVDKITLWEIL